MPPLCEGPGLEEAIRTTLLQLCKVGVTYQAELSLKGTIGLTIDKKEVILMHFNECVENSNTVVDSSQAVAGSSAASQSHKSPTNRSASIIKHTSVADIKMMMAEPKVSSASLWHTYLMSNNDAMMREPSSSMDPTQCSGRQIGKIEMPSSSFYDRFPLDERKNLLSLETITIDLDSESDTFDPPLNFEDVEDEKLDDEKKVEQKELALLDEALVSMSGMEDVKTKVDEMDVSRLPDNRLNDSEGENSHSPGKLDIKQGDLGNIPVFVTKSEILDAKQQWDVEDQWEDCDTNTEMLSEADSLNWARSKYYSCEVCGKQLPSIGKLEAHLVETHKLTESREYGSIVFKQCQHCGKKFRFQATLDKHMFLHVAKRSYKCHLCSNNYCFPDSLEIHMGAHTGNYSCKKCKKSYSTKTLFQKHIVYMHEQRQHGNKK